MAKIDRDDPTLAEKILKAAKKLDGIVIADDGDDATLSDMDKNFADKNDSLSPIKETIQRAVLTIHLFH
jgi:hypothetical protein